MKQATEHALRQAIQQMEVEKARLDQAILIVQSALRGTSATARKFTILPGGAKRRPMSATRRKAVSQWMTRYWAKRRRLEGKQAA